MNQRPKALISARAKNEDKRQHFIVGDIDSILIEGTINVLNFRMGMVFWTWGHK